MKFAIFVACCTFAAAVATFNPTINSSVFKPGEEYVYHYQGQILSGIPKSSKQYAGLLLDSLVVLQFQQDYKVVMKLEKIKLFKINNKVVTLPSEPLPESELTILTGEQASVITELLVKPVKFRYEQGEVGQLENEVSDRYWSLNIKKGIISLFQVTLKEKSSYRPESNPFYPDPVMSRIRSSYSPRAFSPNTPYWKLVTKSNDAFNVMEKDVMGVCESKYTVISDKTHLSPSSSQMYVSRVKNFDNCVSKPFHIEGLFQGVYHDPTEKDLIQPTVHTDYVISGDRTHFLIKEAKLRAKYFFLVNGLEGGDLSTYIFQKLSLKTVEPIRQPTHVISPKIDSRGLVMIIPQASLLPRKNSNQEYNSNPMFNRRYPSEQQFIKSYEQEIYEEQEQELYPRTEFSDVTTKVEQELTELVECLYPSSTDKKCSLILYQLSRIVREMNKPELKSILTRYIRGEHSSVSETEYRKAEILLDILLTLPSPSAAKVLIELTKETKITQLRASLLIKPMTMLVQPTPSVIRKLLDLYKELPQQPSNLFSQQQMLRQTSLLGVGTLTHRLINVMRSQGKPIPQIISFVETVSSELNQLLEQSQSETEKVLILKSIGNMGASENIVILKNIVEDPRQTPVIRTQAIYALRRLVKQFKKQVSPILLSTFMDVKEIREVRQAAFVVLIKSKPSYTTLQMIAHRVRHEPSSQIRSLVYSTLVNLAMYTSHQPEHKILIKNARMIMKTLPPVHFKPTDSFELFVNKFSEEYDLGAAFNLIKIKSPMSGLPESLVANIQGTLFGKHRRLIEVGANGKSLELVLRKFFGPHGLLKEYLKGRLSVEDIFRPLTRPEMGRVEQKIREVISQLIEEGRPELAPFGITSELYVHILGNELQFITLNAENIKQVIEKVTKVLPDVLVRLSRGVPVDIIKTVSHIASVNIATPLGIPLSLNATTMGILKVQGRVKINNLPTWSEIINRYSRLEVPRLGLEVDLKPDLDILKCLAMSPDMKWLSTGVGAISFIKAKAPVKVIANLDPIQHSVSIKYFVPQQTKKVVEVDAKPFTFITYVPVSVNKLPFQVEIIDIQAREIVKQAPFNYKYRCSLTGLEVETEGVYSMCGPSWCPIMPLFGKQQLTVITRPATNVEYVQLKIKSLRTNFQWEGVPTSYNTEDLFVKNPEELEEEQRLYNIHSSYRREISRSMIESGEFEPIPVSPILSGEPIKRQVLITFGPNTQQSPKIKTLLTWLMSREYYKNQFNLQVVRMAHGETPAWKIQVDNVVNPLVWYPEETYRGEFLNKLKLKWNLYGNVNELKVKIVPGSPFDFTRELQEHSILPVVTNLPEATAQKYRYSVELELPQMTHKLMKYITVAQDLLKYQFFSKISTSIPTQPINKIVASFEVLPWWEKMNVIVKTPRENTYISNIPIYWNVFQPTSERIRLHDVPAWKWYKSVEDKEYFVDTVPYRTTPLINNECSLSPSEIITYDGVTISVSQITRHLAEPSCEMVFAQHCVRDGIFSVTGRGTSETISVKVLVPKYEIIMSDLKSRGQPTVSINGEEKYLTEGRPLVIREDYNPESPEELVVKKISHGVVSFKSREIGVKVILDTNARVVKIKMSPLSMLQGQLCGMCGTYNMDPSDDYYTPRDFQPENRDLVRMITRNFIKSQTCNVEKFSQMGNDYCKTESHLTINRYDNELPLTCTTETKVPQCAPGCRPKTTKGIKTCFTCRAEEGTTLSRKTFLAPRWDSYDNESVQCQDFFQRVEVPTQCVPAY